MFKVRIGDITTLKTQCIVNASNPTGLGCFTPNHPCIDNAIHKKAGLNLLKECEKLGGIPYGEAKITQGYNLPAKYVIHATGPKKEFDGYEDHELLEKTYINILNLAQKKGIKEIAFCIISSGMYGFDKERAIKTQVNTIRKWIKDQKAEKGIANVLPETIILNAWTIEEFNLYEKYFNDRKLQFTIDKTSDLQNVHPLRKVMPSP